MKKPKYFLVLLIVPFIAQGAEWPQRIEVYVDGPTPISGIHTARSKGVQVDVLDVAPAESFEHQLSRNLPKDQAKATYVARNRINRLTSDRKAGALLAIMVREFARRFGIATYPSVVIDGQTIILEESDIRRAVRRWRDLKKP